MSTRARGHVRGGTGVHEPVFIADVGASVGSGAGRSAVQDPTAVAAGWSSRGRGALAVQWGRSAERRAGALIRANVSIIFDAPCLFYTNCFMFCLHFVAFLCIF
jgi:hypothetical protein